MKEDGGVNGVDADRSGLKRVEEGKRRRGTEPLKEEWVLTKGSRESEGLASLAEHLGVESIVSPRKIISDILVRYARALHNSLGSSVETLYQLMDGKAEAIEFLVSDEPDIVGIPLKDLKLKTGTLIAGIVRDRKILIPGGNDTIEEGDHVIVLGANRRINELSDILK